MDFEDLHESLTLSDHITHLTGRELDRILASPSLHDDTGLVFEGIKNRRDVCVRGSKDTSHEDFYGIPRTSAT